MRHAFSLSFAFFCMVFVLFQNFGCYCCCGCWYFFMYIIITREWFQSQTRYACGFLLLLPLLFSFLFVALNWIANKYTEYSSFSKLMLTRVLFANLWRLWIWLFWVQFTFLVQNTHAHVHTHTWSIFIYILLSLSLFQPDCHSHTVHKCDKVQRIILCHN